MAPLQSGVGVRPEKPSGHVPSPVSCDGLILVVVVIFTGDEVGKKVGLSDTGAVVGKKVGLGDCGAFDGRAVGRAVIGAEVG